uniref:RRM domain-containing protein n=1 Tax=viral metagenome TaxID=1070528 RepID=A0A6C0DFZ5_9ZZZZ
MSKLVNTSNSTCAGSMVTLGQEAPKPIQKGVAKAVRRSTNLFRGSLDKRLTHDQIIARGIAAERAMKSKQAEDSDDDLGVEGQDIAKRCVAVLSRYDNVAANSIEEGAQLDAAVHLHINYGPKHLAALLAYEGVSVEDLPAHERALVSGLGLAGKKTGARATGYKHTEDAEFVAVMRAQQERREAWQAEQALIAAAKLRAKQLADACRVAVRTKARAAIAKLLPNLPALTRAVVQHRLVKLEANLAARTDRFRIANAQNRQRGEFGTLPKCVGCGCWYTCDCADWGAMSDYEDRAMGRIRRFRGILKPLGLHQLIKFTRPATPITGPKWIETVTEVAGPVVEHLPNYLMPVAEEAYVKPKSTICSVRLGNIRYLRNKPELYRFIRDLSDFVKRQGCQIAEKEAIYAPLRDGKSIGFCFLKLATAEQAQLFLERCGPEPMLEDSLTGDRRAMFPELAASDRKSKEEMLRPKVTRHPSAPAPLSAVASALKAAVAATGNQLAPVCLGAAKREVVADLATAMADAVKKRLAEAFPVLVATESVGAKSFEVSFAAVAAKPVVTLDQQVEDLLTEEVEGVKYDKIFLPTHPQYEAMMALSEAARQK